MIADTSFIIDLMRNDTKALSTIDSLIKSNLPLMIPSPVIYELYTGIFRSTNSDKERMKVLEILKNQIVLPLDNAAAELAGEIDGILERKGKRIGAVDSMIAGIALSTNEIILTRNIKDFSKIENLKLEKY